MVFIVQLLSNYFYMLRHFVLPPIENMNGSETNKQSLNLFNRIFQSIGILLSCSTESTMNYAG